MSYFAAVNRYQSAFYLLLAVVASTPALFAQKLNWAKVITGNNNTDKYIGGIVSNRDTTFYVGSSRGVNDPGPIPIGFFVGAKPDNGSPGWTATIPSLDNDITGMPFGGIVQNSRNEIIIGGNIMKRLVFGSGGNQITLSVDGYMGQSSPNLILPFLAKYSTKGVFLSARILAGGSALGVPTSPRVYVKDIAVDSEDNIYVVGTFMISATWDFGLPTAVTHTSMNSPNSAINGFVAKYNSDLELIWVVPIQGYSSSSSIQSITLDITTDSKLIVGGAFRNTFAFRSRDNSFTDLVAYPPGDNTPNTQEVFLAKMDTAGHFVWAKRAMEKIINISDDGRWLNDLDVDDDGNIYIGGSLGGGAILGMGQPNQATLSWAYQYSALAVKYDPDGNYLWNVRGIAYTGDLFAAGRKIACTPEGDCIFGGEFHARQFGLTGATMLTAESSNATPFLAFLNTSGTIIRQTQFYHNGTMGTTYGGYRTNGLTALYITDLSHVYVGGHFFKTTTMALGFGGSQTFTATDNTTALFLTSMEWEVPPPVVTGLEDNFPVSIYPNPAASRVYISVGAPGKFTVDFFNLQGQKIMRSGGDDTISLDTDAFSPGVYLSVITMESGESTTRKVLIQR